MSPTTHARLIGVFAWANLIAQIGIIVSGGAVRLTASGLGCSTWPNCEPGQFTPEFHSATSFHPFIEFGNRTLAGVVLAFALILTVLLYTARRRGLTPRRSAALVRLGMTIVTVVLIQAVLGGMTVWFELHPALVASHFALSGALVALSTYLLLRWREGDAPPRPLPTRAAPVLRIIARVLAVLAAVVVVVGVVVTGAGPHSGDADVGYRFAVDPAAVARWHAVAAWAFMATVLALLVVLHRARPDRSFPPQADIGALATARRRGWLLLGITLAQGIIGYVQYFTGLPELIVGFHLFGAAVLIAAVTAAIMALRVRESRP